MKVHATDDRVVADRAAGRAVQRPRPVVVAAVGGARNLVHGLPEVVHEALGDAGRGVREAHADVQARLRLQFAAC
jgi:hypothetical protein